MLSWVTRYGLPLGAIAISSALLFRTAWVMLPPFSERTFRWVVVAPELSLRWLMLGILTLLFSGLTWRFSWLGGVATLLSLLTVAFCALPLVQFATTHTQMEAAMQQGLRPDYWQQIAPEMRANMRSQPLQVGRSLRGIPLADNVRVQRGIPFAEAANTGLRLNLYRGSLSGPRATIIVIHGGGWEGGSPSNDEFLSYYLAAQGYTVISITYRFAPKYRFPTQLEDVRAALTAIRQRADEWDVDINRVVLLGRSAGAHLAMLVAYQPNPLPIRAVVNYYGVTDLTRSYRERPNPNIFQIHQLVAHFLGGTPDEIPDIYQQASPTTYVRPGLPPTLMIYGGSDTVVLPQFGRDFAQQLRDAGNRVVYLELPWAEHAFDVVPNGLGAQLATYYTERFLAWVFSHSPADSLRLP